MLRAAGYPHHALRVAQAARQSDWVLDILLEDLSAWDEALAVLVGGWATKHTFILHFALAPIYTGMHNCWDTALLHISYALGWQPVYSPVVPTIVLPLLLPRTLCRVRRVPPLSSTRASP